MKAWIFIKHRVYAFAAGISFLFIGLLVINLNFYVRMTEAIEKLYVYDHDLRKDILSPHTVMPRINDLLQKAGIIQWMSIAVFIACIFPVIFILKDYYQMKSIRTIMRLPISKTYYYVDKLLLPVLFLGLYWLMQLLAIFFAERLYLGAVPAEKVPLDVWITMWKNPPASLLYPFAELSRLPAALSFLILIPATVILFVLAERSKKRGVFSGVVACIGIIAVLIHFIDLPSSIWLTPLITAAVIGAGIWHINKIQIT